MKKILRGLLIFLGAVVLAAAIFLAWLTFTEFKPEPVEDAEMTVLNTGKQVEAGKDLTLISWNLGYAALGKDSDFAMDGGHTPPADKELVSKNLAGFSELLYQTEADIWMLQELDSESDRSYGMDFRETLFKDQNAYAQNYSCNFVPYPLPPLGKIHSGLYTATDFEQEKAQRVSLPVPFNWPLRVANLKRCLLISYLPIEGSEKKLVIVNLHLEAFDNGEGKIAQTAKLKEILEEEFAKGNYVIAGGDFNQSFPEAEKMYPNDRPDLWHPGQLDETTIPENWTYAYDPTTPTCRSTNQPYQPEDKENTLYYVIDGFMLSPNIQLNSVETLAEDFVYSDHNPVKLNITLLPEN